MNSINEIYKMLHWDSSSEEQLRGIELAKSCDDLSLFVQPMHPDYNKSIWDNCAKILYDKSDDNLTPYLTELLEWIQDQNWPGAKIILERLKLFSGEKLKQPFENAFYDAIKSDNEEGLMWLDILSELLDNKELRLKLSKDIIEVLQKHYHNWRWWYY